MANKTDKINTLRQRVRELECIVEHYETLYDDKHDDDDKVTVPQATIMIIMLIILLIQMVTDKSICFIMQNLNKHRLENRLMKP